MIYKKGFTLIELLVVIAIIGILSSVVLASLNTPVRLISFVSPALDHELKVADVPQVAPQPNRYLPGTSPDTLTPCHILTGPETLGSASNVQSMGRFRSLGQKQLLVPSTSPSGLAQTGAMSKSTVTGPKFVPSIPTIVNDPSF